MSPSSSTASRSGRASPCTTSRGTTACASSKGTTSHPASASRPRTPVSSETPPRTTGHFTVRSLAGTWADENGDLQFQEGAEERQIHNLVAAVEIQSIEFRTADSDRPIRAWSFAPQPK